MGSLLICRECGDLFDGPDGYEDDILAAFHDHLAEHLEQAELEEAL